MEHVQEGFDVFVHDGENAIGAVRAVRREELVVYVENAGDFVVPLTAIKDVHEEKVILNCALLDLRLRRAIGHTHDGEDTRI